MSWREPISGFGKHTEAQKDMRMKMVGRNSVNSCRQYANIIHLQTTAMLNRTKEINWALERTVKLFGRIWAYVRDSVWNDRIAYMLQRPAFSSTSHSGSTLLVQQLPHSWVWLVAPSILQINHSGSATATMKYCSRLSLKQHNLPKHCFAEQPTIPMARAVLIKCCWSCSSTEFKVGAMHNTSTHEAQASPDRLCDNSVLAAQKAGRINTS